MYIPELFEMTWKSRHLERVCDADRWRMADTAPAEQPPRLSMTLAVNVCRWCLPWLSVLLISTSLVYPVITSMRSRGKNPELPQAVYMGLGIEPEDDAQTPAQLATAQAGSYATNDT
jgi:hypothetical protein